MKRRLVTVLLSFTMLVTALSACGSGTGEGTDPSGVNLADQNECGGQGEAGAQNGGAVDDLSQHRSITAWLYADDYKYYSNAAEKPVVKYLNEMFNCDIEFQQPPMGSESEGLLAYPFAQKYFVSGATLGGVKG